MCKPIHLTIVQAIIWGHAVFTTTCSVGLESSIFKILKRGQHSKVSILFFQDLEYNSKQESRKLSFFSWQSFQLGITADEILWYFCSNRFYSRTDSSPGTVQPSSSSVGASLSSTKSPRTLPSPSCASTMFSGLLTRFQLVSFFSHFFKFCFI